MSKQAWPWIKRARAVAGGTSTLLAGFLTPFDSPAVQRLYPTHASYVSKYTAAAKESLAARFLTAEYYAAAVAEAEKSSIP